jgi:hypothetical protein
VAVDIRASHREAGLDLEVVRAILEVASERAGAADPQEAGHQLQILLIGAIVAASCGDHDAGRVRAMTELLLESSR